MTLNISNNARKTSERTGMSQQALVNTLLNERQPRQTQPIQNQPQPVGEWGQK